MIQGQTEKSNFPIILLIFDILRNILLQIIVFAGTILAFHQAAFTQDNFLFERINIEDGLSNNSINGILQTIDGFLWIATKDGLNRFDGHEFKVFKNSSTDSTSLPENYVMSLLESHSGILYVGTWGGGLCKYDPINECFIQIRQKGYNDNFIQCLFEDHLHNIWFGTTEGGLFVLNPSNGAIANYSKNNTINHIPSNNITSISEDNSCQIWFGTWDAGLIHFNPEKGGFQQLLHDPKNKNTISNNGVWNISNESGNGMILSTFSGIDQINPKTHAIIHNPGFNDTLTSLGPIAIRQTIRDKKGRLWIGSYDYYGLFLIASDESGVVENYRFTNEDYNNQSISIDRIRWIYEDKKSNIWIGTENGLNKLPVRQQFRQFRHLPVRTNSLGGKVVSSILQTKERMLWVGYGGDGFDRIDLQTDLIKHFTFEPTKKNTLSDNDVTYIYESKDGYLWICTMYGGLNQFDPVSEKFIHYSSSPVNSESISLNWVNQVMETSKGVFLVGTNSGLDVLNRGTGKFSRFLPALKEGQKSLPPTISVNALLEDSHQNIWIGTWLDGVYYYNYSERTLTHYLQNKNDPNSISSNKITCIYEDINQDVWFGTHSGGLNKFDSKTGGFKSYTTENGLPNDVVFGIQEDSKANLWISTMKGLVKFNPSEGLIRVYDHYDGLVNNQFNWRACCQNNDGLMYFGGIDGFVSFHPDSIKIDTVAPQVAITSFNIFYRKTALYKSFPASKIIELNHSQNFFSIGFTALDMAPNQKHSYAYKLEGIDPDWVYCGTRTSSFYTDLRHGSFNFQIKASNSDNVWSKPVSLSITILPAWWNTLFIKILGLLTIFGIGILVTRIRFWHLLDIERIRLNIASDLHDEMGSNLSSISVDSQQLMRTKGIDNKSYELASDIYKTTNETIDSIRDIIWFINPKNDGGENTIFKMKEKAASLLVGINWSFEVSDDFQFGIIKLETRRNIFLIYKEALTNIARHSKATSCSIELYKQQNRMCLKICDNGKGFDLTETPKHDGLENIYYRAKKIHAQLDLSSEKDRGTCLILQFSIKDKLTFE
jgi:ligand-binding sensor domain-containing protein